MTIKTARYPETACAKRAEAFFREPGNFVGKSLEDIYQVIGYPHEWADWDLGRIVCAWKDSRVQVWSHTDSHGQINYVELVTLKTWFLFGGSKEVIWEMRA